jgi:hypothetical protein
MSSDRTTGSSHVERVQRKDEGHVYFLKPWRIHVTTCVIFVCVLSCALHTPLTDSLYPP